MSGEQEATSAQQQQQQQDPPAPDAAADAAASPDPKRAPSSTSTDPPRKRRRSTKKGSPGATPKMTERPRLTEQEKKNNHIASEQKRRLAIREGFDRLTEIVPGLEGQGRSESIVLKKSVDHMREVLQERQQLVERIQALGGEVPPELR